MIQPFEQLLEFIEPSATPIETLPPTAWGGHIPFMFCLVSFMRPRNYVELGTHYGASFFAVCQAIQQFKVDCVPTAIDLWLGDQHAGSYPEEVFKEFVLINKTKYHDIGNVIRKEFSDAVSGFENKSIDLLHIDGLHTYEAVRNDYTTWLPKLSKNGVILFHDTVVRKKDFGVWKFWDEIKNEYSSFNFTHSNGLGVLALGSRFESSFSLLLDYINSTSESKNRFNNFFAKAGERALSEFFYREKTRKYQDPYRKVKYIGELATRCKRKLVNKITINDLFL